MCVYLFFRSEIATWRHSLLARRSFDLRFHQEVVAVFCHVDRKSDGMVNEFIEKHFRNETVRTV